ncbi:MAG: hypothetical protein RR053_02440 [Evtepia sp.]
MKTKVEKYFPVGIGYLRESLWIVIGFLASVLYSLTFFVKYKTQYDFLFAVVKGKRLLLPNVSMPDFKTILGDSLVGFVILIFCMLVLIYYHYRYHYEGSKSIYLMKRLPNRYELLRRCVTVPLVVLVVSFLTALLLLWLYFEFYLWTTPASCLTPNQWHKLWYAYLGG